MNKTLLIFLEITFVMYLLGAFFSLVLLQIAAVIFLLSGILIFFYEPDSYKPKAFNLVVTAFLVSAFVSLFQSPEPSRAVQVLMHPIILWGILPVSILFRYSKKFSINRLGFAIMILGTLCALAGIFHHITGSERTYGFTGGYFTLAALMAVTIPVSLGKAQQEMGWKLWTYAGLVIIQLVALWFTYTRTAFGALIVTFLLAIVFYVWRNRYDITHDIWFAGIMYAIPVLFLLIMMLLSSDPRINPVYTDFEADTTQTEIDLSSGRTGIYQDGLNIIMETVREGDLTHLLFGFGLASRKILLDSGYHSWESDYLEALINQGIIGLGLLLTIYIMFLVKVVKISLRANNYLWFGFAQSGLAFWLMSFLTIQLQGIYSAASFAIIYGALAAWTKETSGPFWNTPIDELVKKLKLDIPIDILTRYKPY
jgi:hypothetical protein